MRLAVSARWWWVVQGHLARDGGSSTECFERTAGAPKELRARALVQGAIFPFRQGDTRRAADLLQESLDLYRDLGDEEGIARSTAELGGIAIAEGDLDRAAALYRRPFRSSAMQGYPSRVAAGLGNLGTIAHMRRRTRPPSATTRRRSSSRRRRATSTAPRSTCTTSRGRSSPFGSRPGLEALRESLAIARGLGYREVIAYCIGGLAELAMIEADPERAAMMLGASDSSFARSERCQVPTRRRPGERVAAYVVEELGGASRGAAGTGAAIDLDKMLDDVASRA